MAVAEGLSRTQAAPDAGTAQRDQIKRRVQRLKKAAIVGTAVGFASLWGLAAHHIVGVTAGKAQGTASQSSSTQPPAQSQSPAQSQGNGDFFGGGSSSVGQGGGSGSGPVLGSGNS